MSNRGKKQGLKIARLIYIGVIAIVMAWMLLLGRNSFMNAYLVGRDLRQLETEVDKLRLANDSLRTENERLKTSLDAAEKAAREQFGLIKPDEKVFRFIPQD